MPHPNCTYLCSIRRIIHSVSDASCLRFTLFSFLVAATAMAQTQQPIGTVGVQDTTVVGALEVANGRAVLVGNTAITAKDHTAEIALTRGGTVRVCSTSGLHLTPGKTGTGVQPLMLALDRGAIEVEMATNGNDIILTPDLRFSVEGSGQLDLRLRVTRNGDTCVDNHGTDAPTLRVADQFGEASYDLHAGQHVLFEHGSLKEVVDRETSPCGCPPAPVVSVADAGTASSTPAAPGSVVAADHPFPAAVSQGLAPDPAVPAAPAGVVHAQVATTLNYDAGATPGGSSSAATGAGTASNSGGSPSGSTVAPAPASSGAAQPAAASSPAVARAEAPPAPAPPSTNDLAHRIGRFFKRLFGG
jgi:hypothetical protein